MECTADLIQRLTTPLTSDWHPQKEQNSREEVIQCAINLEILYREIDMVL